MTEPRPKWMKSRYTRPSTIRRLALRILAREKQSAKDWESAARRAGGGR